jgi:hypothetical protein
LRCFSPCQLLFDYSPTDVTNLKRCTDGCYTHEHAEGGESGTQGVAAQGVKGEREKIERGKAHVDGEWGHNTDF